MRIALLKAVGLLDLHRSGLFIGRLDEAVLASLFSDGRLLDEVGRTFEVTDLGTLHLRTGIAVHSNVSCLGEDV